MDAPPPLRSLRKAERALAHVSRLLVSRAGANLDAILALIGSSFEADHVYVAFAASEFVHGGPAGALNVDVPAVPAAWLGTSRTWSRPGAPALTHDLRHAVDVQARRPPEPAEADGDSSFVRLFDPMLTTEAFALPLLSEEQRFVGYLGFVMPGGRSVLSGRHGRVLSVLGDILGAHLSRLAADEARVTTERRWQSLVDRHPDSILVTVGGHIVYANVAAARLLGAADPDELRAFTFRDFVSASDLETVERMQRAQLATPTPTPAPYVVLRLDGDERYVESVSVPFSGPEGGVQTVLHDVTQRVHSERRYQAFVEAISEGVWRIDLDAPVGTTAPADVQARQIVQHGRLSEVNPAMARILGRTLPEIGTPVHAFSGSRGLQFFTALAAAGHRLHDYEMRVHNRDGEARYLSVNAVGQSDRSGMLVSVWGSSTDITDRVAMERAMVDALEEQQERIGRDLHDGVGQLLTGVRMMSENVAAQVAGQPAARTAERIAAYASEALDQVRAICRGLVPPHLYSEGVASALADLVAQADALGPARCTFRHGAGADVAEADVALQYYRVAQEALSNALRHAHATRVHVAFEQTDGGVAMTVRDDGIGFVLDASRARSIGLFSMRRRAHLVGASLTVESRPGQGTTVRLVARPGTRAPVAAAQAEAPAA